MKDPKVEYPSLEEQMPDIIDLEQEATYKKKVAKVKGKGKCPNPDCCDGKDLSKPKNGGFDLCDDCRTLESGMGI